MKHNSDLNPETRNELWYVSTVHYLSITV